MTGILWSMHADRGVTRLRVTPCLCEARPWPEPALALASSPMAALIRVITALAIHCVGLASCDGHWREWDDVRLTPAATARMIMSGEAKAAVQLFRVGVRRERVHVTP